MPQDYKVKADRGCSPGEKPRARNSFVRTSQAQGRLARARSRRPAGARQRALLPSKQEVARSRSCDEPPRTQALWLHGAHGTGARGQLMGSRPPRRGVTAALTASQVIAGVPVARAAALLGHVARRHPMALRAVPCAGGWRVAPWMAW
jgi:hypothetical protein